MRIKTNIVKLLAVLVILGSLVAIAAVPASAAGALNPNTGSGVVGASFTMTASTFAGTTILTAKFDGVAMTTAPTTVTTDATGNITFAVLIPTATAGAHTISVTDGVNTATATYTVLQKVVITSPTSKKGPVGTSVTVAGTGFSGAGVTADLTITAGTTKVLVSGVPVDNTGSFSGTGTVPQMGSGAATVSASDGAGNVADVTDTFTVTPTMVLTPNTGLPGATVALTGNGWPVAPATVSVSLGGGPTQTFAINGSGQINTPYVIDVAATAGVKTVTGTSGAVTATTTFTVVGRQLTLTPGSGPKGTIVLMTGSNMTPGGTMAAANLLFGGAPWPNAPATINIDSAGTIFPTTLVVANGATLGANTVQATDSGTLIAYGTFAVTKPAITLNPVTGPINSAVTITGTGWLSGATVTLTFGYMTSGTPSVAATTAITTIPDATGNIAAAITVPADAKAGAATVTAADTKTNAADAATFTVPGAIIAVNPSHGPLGTQVSVTGSGFAAYTAITVRIGNYPFLSQPLTNPLGVFTYTFTVPGLAAGSQSVSATDGTFSPPTGNVASAYFVIEQTGATVQSITAGINSQLVRVWGYSGGTWSMYDPADAAGSNLATLTSGSGYWINVNAACTLIYGGYSYPLSAGWNLIGWR